VIFVFSHLHKAAGTTVNAILRRTFGNAHVDVEPVKGFLYSPSDLGVDIGRFGVPVSIAGHCLRPYVDFGSEEEGMFWYTVAREPISRCISHYQHQQEKMGKNLPLEKWLENPRQRNWMVRFYGGTFSVESALEALRKKRVRVIMLNEGLEKGLQDVFHGTLAWKVMRRNPSRSGKPAFRIKEDPGLVRLVRDANELDLELYERMRGLERPEALEIPARARTGPVISSFLSFLGRNLRYRPWKHRLIARTEGDRE